MEEAPARDPRRLSALSCVWPGKLLTPKSAHAVPANVDHLVQLVSPAKTEVMAPTAKTEIREAQAKMPERKKNCCPFHLNASAWRNPAQLDPLAPRAPMDHPEMVAAQEEMVNPDHKDPLAHPDHLAPMATLVLLVLLERLAN